MHYDSRSSSRRSSSTRRFLMGRVSACRGLFSAPAPHTRPGSTLAKARGMFLLKIAIIMHSFSILIVFYTGNSESVSASRVLLATAAPRSRPRSSLAEARCALLLHHRTLARIPPQTPSLTLTSDPTFTANHGPRSPLMGARGALLPCNLPLPLAPTPFPPLTLTPDPTFTADPGPQRPQGPDVCLYYATELSS